MICCLNHNKIRESSTANCEKRRNPGQLTKAQISDILGIQQNEENSNEKRRLQTYVSLSWNLLRIIFFNFFISNNRD
jgi:poly-gamma-glutamate capsule biosynthesis protein CapA/YwtB (metallophosphatase superfamily)